MGTELSIKNRLPVPENYDDDGATLCHSAKKLLRAPGEKLGLVD